MVETRSAVPGDVLHGDADLAAGRPLDRAVGERAEPDLGALQVGQDGDGVAGACPRPPAPAGRRWRGAACAPWLKFSRATSIPASTRAVICSRELVAGPRVQTILARRDMATNASGVAPVRDPRGAAVAGRTASRRGRRSESVSAQRDRGRGDRPGQLGVAGQPGVGGARRRPGPRRSPRRSATARGRCRRRRTRRARWT